MAKGGSSEDSPHPVGSQCECVCTCLRSRIIFCRVPHGNTKAGSFYWAIGTRIK